MLPPFRKTHSPEHFPSAAVEQSPATPSAPDGSSGRGWHPATQHSCGSHLASHKSTQPPTGYSQTEMLLENAQHLIHDRSKKLPAPRCRAPCQNWLTTDGYLGKAMPLKAAPPQHPPNLFWISSKSSLGVMGVFGQRDLR